jgi:hypothetical protein
VSKLPDTSGAGVVLGAEDLAHAGKVRAATETVDSIAASCGATVRLERNAVGRLEKVATVPANVAMEAMRKPWAMDTEREQHTQALRPTETLTDEHGKPFKVWNIHAEQVAKERKLKPAWTRGRPSYVCRDGVWWKNAGSGVWVQEAPPSRLHELLESRQSPAGVVH